MGYVAALGRQLPANKRGAVFWKIGHECGLRPPQVIRSGLGVTGYPSIDMENPTQADPIYHEDISLLLLLRRTENAQE